MMLLDRSVSSSEVKKSERVMIFDILVKFWLKTDFFNGGFSKDGGTQILVCD